MPPKFAPVVAPPRRAVVPAPVIQRAPAAPPRPTPPQAASSVIQRNGDYAPPPRPTLWDFIAPVIRGADQRAHRAMVARRTQAGAGGRNARALARQGVAEVSFDGMPALFPEPVAPAPAPPRRGRARFVPLVLGPPPKPHELLTTPASRIPVAGPARFGAAGLNHEYTYTSPGGVTVYIHVHRTGSGWATKAQSKEHRFRYIVGKGHEQDIGLASLGNYGINARDTT